jgi:predicted amidophosphoribosyltransferase
VEKICPVCGKQAFRWGNWKYCWPCYEAALPFISRAYYRVHAAVAAGKIPHPSTLICADCGAPAQFYDHRDYEKPLAVDPVCRGCNYKRGPAKQLQAA